jgi:hypothetical protein
MALILGASHEAFSIPLSGAMLIYVCCNIKSVFKTQRIYPIISLGLGTIALLLSPANYHRLSGAHKGGAIYSAMNNIDNMVHVRFVWIALIALLLFVVINRSEFKRFVMENYLLMWTLFWAVVCAFIVNTGPHSLTGVELVSLLIVMKLLLRIKWSKCNKFLLYGSSAAILAVIVFVQIQVVRYGKIQMNNYEKCMEEYIASDDGIFRKPIIDKPFYVQPYILDWSIRGNNQSLIQNIQKDYHQWGKKGMPLIDTEYDALADGSMFDAKNMIPGGSGFYGVENGLGFWAHKDSINLESHRFEFEYLPVHFSSPNTGLCLGVKFALFPDSYPNQEMIDTISNIKTRWGDFYFIEKPLAREVIAIKAIEK